jgi:hypothetical protein
METLEILAGLIFIYLLLSLVCTALNELIAQFINLRGKTLRTGLRSLLEGPDARTFIQRLRGLFSQSDDSKTSAAAKSAAAAKRDAAWQELEAQAKAEAAAWKGKARELREALAKADLEKGRALRAATLAERSQTDDAAREATKATTERNSAQDAVMKRTNELAAAREVLFARARPQAEKWESAEAEAGRVASPVSTFYDHPLIVGLRPTSLLKGSRLPSYIPADTFAVALLGMVPSPEGGSPKAIQSLREGVQNLPPQLQKSLTVLIDQAGDSVEELQLKISKWFSDAMERVSGVYKRRTQIIILLIGLGTTVLLNADTIRIWHTLSTDAAVRAALVSAAETYVKQPANKPQPASTTGQTDQADSTALSAALARADSAIGRIDSLAGHGVPLGWRASKFDSSMLPGWLITALAISLGAPFWFDMLNKVMNVRAAGRAPEEKPKSPEALPPPRGV